MDEVLRKQITNDCDRIPAKFHGSATASKLAKLPSPLRKHSLKLKPSLAI